MTDIEVGSLWARYGDEKDLMKVVAVTDNNVFFEFDDNTGDCLNIDEWHESDYATPYTPPKEYKVWVYESKCGNVEVYRESQCERFSARNGFMTLKAILTGKEGDGL